MNIITKIKEKNYKFTTLYRVALASGVVAASLTASFILVTVPKIVAAWEEWQSEELSQYVYQAPERASSTPAAADKLETYYTEEKAKLKEKFEKGLENTARKNAIERVQADLEKEKEALRGEELFL